MWQSERTTEGGQAMTRSVLLVGLDPDELGASGSMLRRREVDLQRSATASEGLKAMRSKRFDLVICGYPLPDLLLRDFIAGGRSEVGPSHASAVLVVAPPGMEIAARSAASAERCEVVGRSSPAPVVHEVLGRLLEAAPRVAPRIDLKLHLSVGPAGAEMATKVVNISSTGMLVEGLTELEVGTTCGFEIGLLAPGGAVRGDAEVVRHTSVRRELVRGVALRFVSFEPRERLKAVLRVEGSTEEPPSDTSD